MKALYTISLFLIVFSVGFFVAKNFNKNTKKQKITSAMRAYTDSIDATLNELFLLDKPLNPSADVRHAFDAVNANMHERMAIKKRMWQWQWKIDSCNMELKKY